jgi:AraC-like DNA-binding protein
MSESLYDEVEGGFLAKIAVDVEQALTRRAVHGSRGRPTARLLARGDGWIVEDVICTCGPQDHPFEEQHATVSIAMVVAGSFQYAADSRTSQRPELMTPGSMLLGNPGQYFECQHTHGAGDRCISFRYATDFFARIAADAGVRDSTSPFRLLRLPPLRALSPLVGLSCAGLVGSVSRSWEELSVQVAARTAKEASGLMRRESDLSPETVGRVTRVVRAIERHPDGRLTLDRLARSVELSPYHFLRTFERVTGVTPHQFVLRSRLREAATRLAGDPSKVLDVALDCGFGDLSNFNRAFRAEFGVAPRVFRAGARRGKPVGPAEDKVTAFPLPI